MTVGDKQPIGATFGSPLFYVRSGVAGRGAGRGAGLGWAGLRWAGVGRGGLGWAGRGKEKPRPDCSSRGSATRCTRWPAAP